MYVLINKIDSLRDACPPRVSFNTVLLFNTGPDATGLRLHLIHANVWVELGEPTALSLPPSTPTPNVALFVTPTAIPTAIVPVSSVLPQASQFTCGTGTAETRYVVDRSGALVFDRVDAGATTLGTLAFRSSVQVYGTVTGRLSGNSNKWYAVRYGERCAYIWVDPASSRLSTTQPK